MTYLGRFRMKLGENPWFGGPSRKVQNIKKSTPLLLFERKKFLTRWYQEHIYYLVAEGATKYVTVTRVLVTLFADLGYLVPLLEGARFDTRRYMKGTWRRTHSCTSTAPTHHFRISQYPKRLPPILKMNFFSDKELRAL